MNLSVVVRNQSEIKEVSECDSDQEDSNPKVEADSSIEVEKNNP